MKPVVKYQKGYKYRLYENYKGNIAIYPEARIESKFGVLYPNGYVEIFEGFCWDGCSGPTIDQDKNMRGGLVHDFLCYLMRQGLLDRLWHPAANIEFREILIEDGFYWPGLYYFAVDKCGGFASDPKNKRKVFTAP